MTLQQIESQIASLPPGDISALADWLDKFIAEKSNDAFEKSVLAGKFDALGDQAVEDFKNGKCTDL